jgi:sugar phosphate isomerase/epimerase
MYGVSPAWFISRFGNKFSVKEMISDFKNIKNLGFNNVQLEVFHEEKASEWTSKNIELLNLELENQKLKSEQFVAHYMLGGFITPKRILSDIGEETYKELISKIRNIADIKRICVPMPGLICDEVLSFGEAKKIKLEALNKLKRLCDITNDNGLEFCVEIMPYSFLGGLTGFIEAKEKINNLNLCLDVKHAYFSRENFDYILPQLEGSIVSTHLCDNFGIENTCNRPGKGNVMWEELLLLLNKIRYKGTYDLEIIAAPHEVFSEYKFGKDFVEKKFKNKNKD